MMLLPWTACTSEQVRRLALLRRAEGWSQRDVAEFVGVRVRTVRRWESSAGENPGLLFKPRSGRPPKLDAEQAGQVLAWLDRDAGEFGFPTERWTAPRVRELIERTWGIRYNPRYLNDWLRHHGVTPQMPQKQPRERDEGLIESWVRHQWPRIKKRPANFTGSLVLQTKAASCSRP